MVLGILAALARIKVDVASDLQVAVIEQFCRELGHSWRNRILTPAVTVHAFLLQVLHQNTACAAPEHGLRPCAASHVPHLMCGDFTGDAYCQARRRVPLGLFERLSSAIVDALGSCRDQAALWPRSGRALAALRPRSGRAQAALWCGHRVWLLDGSSCSMPDTPKLQEAFGQPGA